MGITNRKKKKEKKGKAQNPVSTQRDRSNEIKEEGEKEKRKNWPQRKDERKQESRVRVWYTRFQIVTHHGRRTRRSRRRKNRK
jgi:hypothetical protein